MLVGDKQGKRSEGGRSRRWVDVGRMSAWARMMSSARRRQFMVPSHCTASRLCSTNAKDRVGGVGRLVGALLGILMVGGCVEKVSQKTEYSENSSFGNRPTVISSTP